MSARRSGCATWWSASLCAHQVEAGDCAGQGHQRAHRDGGSGEYAACADRRLDGQGKSVAINAMIMSVLFKSTPEQVRMILVDPKRVELGMYEGIPHLFTPIITEAKLAANALRNAVREMERRLKLLAADHVRNIDQFNKLFENGSEYLFEDVNQEPLPYIIIIIDELADLMMLDRRTSKSRSRGWHRWRARWAFT
jgi:hypothetical protein